MMMVVMVHMQEQQLREEVVQEWLKHNQKHFILKESGIL
jgi:hypothetical protein